MTTTVTPEEALELIRQGEGQKVEFKQSFSEENKAIESLCAFANIEGGTVIFGVTRHGEVHGASLGANTLENFVNRLRAHTDPPLSPIIDRLTAHGREIVAVVVPKHPPGQLFYAFGKPHIRVGPTNQIMTPEECRARLAEGQQRRAEETNRFRISVAPPLAGPQSEGVDALALGQEIASTRDQVRLRGVVRLTRMFFAEEWPSRIEELGREPINATRIPENEIWQHCLPYIERFAPDMESVEAFGLPLVEAENTAGLVEMLRIVQDWITMSDKIWPGPSLKAITGAPGLLALRMLATWGAKAADCTSLTVLGTLLTHPLEILEAGGQAATLPLVDRTDMFHPNALLDHADLAVRYLQEEPWKNREVARMFAGHQDYLDGLSRFLFLAALLREARHPDENWPLYPGFKLVVGSSRSIHSFVGRISASPQLMDSLATMANEDLETFRSNWPKRARRLNDAQLGERYFTTFRRIPEEI